MAVATKELSTRQAMMYGYIVDYIRRRGYGPTHREIMEDCEVSSTSVVAYNLTALRRMGYINELPGTTRSISLTSPAHGELCPLCGRGGD